MNTPKPKTNGRGRVLGAALLAALGGLLAAPLARGDDPLSYWLAPTAAASPVVAAPRDLALEALILRRERDAARAELDRQLDLNRSLVDRLAALEAEAGGPLAD